ncbi:MAG: zincin-like metallopeptidase domain-containing protein, partial [bacterium]
TVVSGMPKRPDIQHNGNGAFYRPRTDTVSLPGIQAFDSPQEYYSTLFHELTHSTGHESRLNRHKQEGYASHRFGSSDYSREELVAEMGAAFMCGHCNTENRTIDNSAAYIDGWRSRLGSDPRLVVTAAAQAQRAADFIFGRDYTENE